MDAALAVRGMEIKPREYNGQRVVTFRDIDKVHDRPEGTARWAFNRNRQHFKEDKDFYKVIQLSVLRTLEISSNFGVILLTESGYLMLVKVFGDPKAWQVQRALVETYFRAKNVPNTLPPKGPPLPTTYAPKGSLKLIESSRAPDTTNAKMRLASRQSKIAQMRKAIAALEVAVDIYDDWKPECSDEAIKDSRSMMVSILTHFTALVARMA